MIEGKSRKRTNKNVLKEEDVHNIARLFAEDIRRYLDEGGERKNLKASHVYAYLKKIEDYRKSEMKLGVRGDSDERTI